MKNTDDPSFVRFRCFTVLLVFVLALQSAGGILIPQLYHDSPWVIASFRGTDIVTLAVIIPLLIGMQIFLQRGALRARLVWVGVLYYIFYNNLYYLFSAYNAFFLVYVAIFILSLSALITALISTNSAAVAGCPASEGYRRVISFIMIALAAVLGLTWIAESVNYIFTRQMPQIIIDTGGSSNLVAILDLTLIVPPFILGSVLLWRAQIWGYIISAVMIVQFALLTVSLIFTAPVQAAAGINNAWAMVPILIPMGIACSVAAIMLFRKIPNAAPGSSL